MRSLARGSGDRCRYGLDDAWPHARAGIVTVAGPDLSGRCALVTGASMGMGATTVQRLAEHGAAVIFCSRSQENLDALAASLEGLPGKVLPVAADLSTVAGASRLCDALDTAGHLVDILVNNLGHAPIRDFAETTDEQWEELFRVNLFNAVHITRRVLPHMISQRWGRVIMIASVAAHDPNPNLIDYSASKAALLAMATGLARNYGHANVLVNTLSPGGVLTPLAEQTARDAVARGEAESVDELHSRQARGVPLQRFARPAEIADVVAFLCSSGADYITGTEICVDGGWPTNCLRPDSRSSPTRS
jgi:NAD(P)-dependent dehydrogenase (short-subunit alcohol dehydrogenase family)